MFMQHIHDVSHPSPILIIISHFDILLFALACSIRSFGITSKFAQPSGQPPRHVSENLYQAGTRKSKDTGFHRPSSIHASMALGFGGPAQHIRTPSLARQGTCEDSLFNEQNATKEVIILEESRK